MLDQKSGSAPIGITMGCPASIGPELIVKFHLARPRSEQFPLVIIGDLGVLEKICTQLDLTKEIRIWKPGMKIEKIREEKRREIFQLNVAFIKPIKMIQCPI